MPNNHLTSQKLLDALYHLAMDLHWSWNHATDKIWKQLDPVLWELTHNPLVVLQTVSSDRIKKVLEDPLVEEIVEELAEEKRERLLSPGWFQKEFPETTLNKIAFFSMEFMLSEALPIYAGGLGNVSGDLLKTASDLGVPLVGVGLFFQQGYPRQVIHKDGTQQYVLPFNEPGQLPVTPLRMENGEWLRIEIKLGGFSLWLRTWQVQVGRTLLYLLDSNDTANYPPHRSITGEMYGSDAEIRLLQEIILGIGGWKLLRALNVEPEICHLNEGHTAFAAIERVSSYMEQHDQPFDVALTVTRSGNIFTTHTAIGAGFDRFPDSMILQYLGRYIQDNLHLLPHEFLALGKNKGGERPDLFNIGYLALAVSNRVNGVSRLHGHISRQIFGSLFPRWPVYEVPVQYVTNGVHMPSWDSPEADKLWTEACGKERWLGTPLGMLQKEMETMSNERLWDMRKASKKRFIDELQIRHARQLKMMGITEAHPQAESKMFSPDHLTIGFGRRFTAYKRPNLLLTQPERLRQILLNADKPVQLVVAGKAHRGDAVGQALIGEWIRFINSMPAEDPHVVFLSDYDMLVTEQLVQGVDLWINTPLRPWEACGTSGMKVLVNGGLNFSELDGWWDEAYTPEVGWTYCDRDSHADENKSNEAEAEKIYKLLENEIVPEYYDRSEDDLPVKWIQRVRESMARLTPRFSSVRALKQYVQEYYRPAVNDFILRAEYNSSIGKELTEWKRNVEKNWKDVFIEKMEVTPGEGELQFEVKVNAGKIQPEDLAIELYADPENDENPFILPMKLNPIENNSHSILCYKAIIKTQRPQTHFTPRIRPVHDQLPLPLECRLIYWYR